jgi:hypothetical protein
MPSNKRMLLSHKKEVFMDENLKKKIDYLEIMMDRLETHNKNTWGFPTSTTEQFMIRLLIDVVKDLEEKLNR